MLTNDSSEEKGNFVETTAKVCLQHDRYWPCRRLVPADREHVWADQRVFTVYVEKDDDEPRPTL